MNIVLMTREPQHGKNNWLIVAQDKNYRGVVWGKGRINYQGVKYEEVSNSMEDYISNRKRMGYAVQVMITINVPTRKIRNFVTKNLPTILKYAGKVYKAVR